ncbi:hypothetical protein [Rhodococcus ruber]|uniref:hypothetical protein n=1 Tax=Rhodococcus ruber TaxID=1830 RepID=UPI00265D68E3|nr:hypothetical protein [Rhodococcus ruber]MDO1481408.1 hypothetical protein [Rhodococcus ruber]
MPTDDRTLDEIRLLRGELQAGLQRIEDKTVHKDVFAQLVLRVADLEQTTITVPRFDGLTAKVASIESTMTWIARLILTAVILAVLGAVVAVPTIGG